METTIRCAQHPTACIASAQPASATGGRMAMFRSAVARDRDGVRPALCIITSTQTDAIHKWNRWLPAAPRLRDSVGSTPPVDLGVLSTSARWSSAALRCSRVERRPRQSLLPLPTARPQRLKLTPSRSPTSPRPRGALAACHPLPRTAFVIRLRAVS